MRYKAVVSCTDFDGRFYRKGEIVDLPEGKHSDFLVPLDAPMPMEAVTEEAETVTEETEADTEETETITEEAEPDTKKKGTAKK